MNKIVKNFHYQELGNSSKVRSYSIDYNDDESYTLKINNDNRTYKLRSKDVQELFKKYDFLNLSTQEVYPFKIKDQIDYRIVITYFNQNDNLDFNGYSHFPVYYNDFINDLAKLVEGRTFSSLKVKDEMLDKDDKYKTNYAEKISIYSKCGDVIISKDRLTDSEYDVDISVPELNSYFKKEDLNFVLPINVHYMTYILKKICKFNDDGDTRKKPEINNYIDIRFHNKKHRYFDLDNEQVKENLIKLLSYLELYIKISILNSFKDPNFVSTYIKTHAKPKNKNQVIKEFKDLISEDKVLLLEALKRVAKNNPNFSMYELVGIAYHQQDEGYVYLIKNKDKFEFREIKLNLTKPKIIEKYFDEGNENISFFDISKDYDGHYYEDEKGIIHMMIVATRYQELEFLKLEDKFKPLIETYFKK